MILKKDSIKAYRNTTVLLLVLLVISLGVNITQYITNQHQSQIIDKINKEIQSITPLMTLFNMTITSPTTRYIDGAKIVPSTTLHLLEDLDSNDCSIDDDIAFYVPYDNVTLEVRFYLTPCDGYGQEIYLQKGNAYRNESGVLVEGNPEDQRVVYDGFSTHIYNATVWRSPVIWETIARNGESYSVLLEERGWYTISLWSPVHISIGGLEKSGSMILRDNNTVPFPPRIESWLEIRVTKNREPVLFLIKHF